MHQVLDRILQLVAEERRAGRLPARETKEEGVSSTAVLSWVALATGAAAIYYFGFHRRAAALANSRA
jgi:hypothetical protein